MFLVLASCSSVRQVSHVRENAKLSHFSRLISRVYVSRLGCLFSNCHWSSDPHLISRLFLIRHGADATLHLDPTIDCDFLTRGNKTKPGTCMIDCRTFCCRDADDAVSRITWSTEVRENAYQGFGSEKPPNMTSASERSCGMCFRLEDDHAANPFLPGATT